MDKPLVSIVLSCHNRARLLPQTMESIFAQSYRPVEIVAVDDGSTDATPRLVAAYGDQIRYVRQQNRGIAVARTTGGRLARGEFIAFQDDDDLMAPDRIHHLITGFKKYPNAVLAVGDYAFLDSDGKATGETSQFQIHERLSRTDDRPVLIENGYAAVLWPKLTPLPHTTLFRRKDGEAIGWFDPGFFHACSDTDFFARLGRLGPIVYLPQIVSYYRCGHSSIWNERLSAAYSRFLLFEKHIKWIDDKQSPLLKRLQYRLCETLKHIVMLSRQGDSNCELPNALLEKGLSLLGVKHRLNFTIYKTCMVPIREKLLELDFSLPLLSSLASKFRRNQAEDKK